MQKHDQSHECQNAAMLRQAQRECLDRACDSRVRRSRVRGSLPPISVQTHRYLPLLSGRFVLSLLYLGHTRRSIPPILGAASSSLEAGALPGMILRVSLRQQQSPRCLRGSLLATILARSTSS